MPKTLDTTLQKAKISYEHGKISKEIMKKNRDKSEKLSDNHKPGFNPHPYRKENNSFPGNKNFNKLRMKPYV